jgi:thioredoxin reductase (NADPH)
MKMVTLDDGQVYSALSVILTLGGRSRTLGVPGEDELKGKGISYCATCDGDFFTDKEIIVVGGGNSALEEAVSLTKYARKVTVVHKLDRFEAHQHAIEEATKHPKVDFIMESVITAFHGKERLLSVDIKDLTTGAVVNQMTDGVFIFIGYVPNTETLVGKLDLNQAGEIIVSGEMQTSVPGVFAAGDCTAKRYRQITTAVADGTIAALAAADYIERSA